MDPERERVARRTMRDECYGGSVPRHLPSWNESVKAILAIERAINGGEQLSLELPNRWIER